MSPVHASLVKEGRKVRAKGERAKMANKANKSGGWDYVAEKWENIEAPVSPWLYACVRTGRICVCVCVYVCL